MNVRIKDVHYQTQQEKTFLSVTVANSRIYVSNYSRCLEKKKIFIMEITRYSVKLGGFELIVFVGLRRRDNPTDSQQVGGLVWFTVSFTSAFIRNRPEIQ